MCRAGDEYGYNVVFSVYTCIYTLLPIRRLTRMRLRETGRSVLRKVTSSKSWTRLRMVGHTYRPQGRQSSVLFQEVCGIHSIPYLHHSISYAPPKYCSLRFHHFLHTHHHFPVLKLTNSQTHQYSISCAQPKKRHQFISRHLPKLCMLIAIA